MKFGRIYVTQVTVKSAKRAFHVKSLTDQRLLDHPRHCNSKGQTIRMQLEALKDVETLDQLEELIGEMKVREQCGFCGKYFREFIKIGGYNGTIIFCKECCNRIAEAAQWGFKE